MTTPNSSKKPASARKSVKAVGAEETATRYQQLRSHLATLKLHAAAEALPSVLEQAASENLSATATLEKLLRIEVDETEARRLTGRLRFANLQTPASLENFDVDAASGIDRPLLDELATCRFLESATNVLLIGRAPERPIWQRVWRERPRTPVTAPTSPRPRISRPGVTGRRSRADGRPRCGSTPDRRCWSSTNSGICPCRARRPPRCFRLCRNGI